MLKRKLAVALGAVVLTPMLAFAKEGGIQMAEEWTMALDGTRIINAIIVLGAFAYLAVRFGAPILKNRADTIATELETLNKAKAEAEKSLKSCEARLHQIELEAAKITAEARAEGEDIKEKIISQAKASAKHIISKAGEQISLESDLARRRLYEETMAAAVTMAEEIIANNIGPDDHKRLIETYIANVENQQ
jgi:F-type H+-transporting ATPase subunit b